MQGDLWFSIEFYEKSPSCLPAGRLGVWGFSYLCTMLQQYCASLTEYRRLKTREVKIGNLLIGNGHPIRIQTMTTTDTMDTAATVAQSIRCIEAGAELVRITAPSKNEAENLLNIKNELRAKGYDTPLIADIHFTPNAAEIAARIVEKVRVWHRHADSH